MITKLKLMALITHIKSVTKAIRKNIKKESFLTNTNNTNTNNDNGTNIFMLRHLSTAHS